LALSSAAYAATPSDYPSRPVRLLVPFAPGGGADALARIITPKLAQGMGQQWVVDNRTGAGGNIGAQIVAKSPADGYTMLNVSLAHAINATLYQKLPYDVVKDFEAVTLLGSSPLLLGVYPGVPAKNVAELVAYAKTRPLNFGSGGAGAISHLSGELFKRAAKIDIAHVPYKGGSLAANDLMSGQIHLMFNAVPELIQFVKAGRVRAIAVTSRERYALVPDLPTMIESGYPGFEAGNWIGVVVPAGTPKPVVEMLAKQMSAAVRTPEVREKFAAQGIDALGTTPEAFKRLLASDVEKWGRVVKETGAKAD
jgi:tripartite-type tricarboxylate transporter receptor subunit TctC